MEGFHPISRDEIPSLTRGSYGAALFLMMGALASTCITMQAPKLSWKASLASLAALASLASSTNAKEKEEGSLYRHKLQKCANLKEGEMCVSSSKKVCQVAHFHFNNLNHSLSLIKNFEVLN